MEVSGLGFSDSERLGEARTGPVCAPPAESSATLQEESQSFAGIPADPRRDQQRILIISRWRLLGVPRTFTSEFLRKFLTLRNPTNVAPCVTGIRSDSDAKNAGRWRLVARTLPRKSQMNAVVERRSAKRRQRIELRNGR